MSQPILQTSSPQKLRVQIFWQHTKAPGGLRKKWPCRHGACRLCFEKKKCRFFSYRISTKALKPLTYISGLRVGGSCTLLAFSFNKTRLVSGGQVISIFYVVLNWLFSVKTVSGPIPVSGGTLVEAGVSGQRVDWLVGIFVQKHLDTSICFKMPWKKKKKDSSYTNADSKWWVNVITILVNRLKKSPKNTAKTPSPFSSIKHCTSGPLKKRGRGPRSKLLEILNILENLREPPWVLLEIPTSPNLTRSCEGEIWPHPPDPRVLDQLFIRELVQIPEDERDGLSCKCF